MRHRHSCIELRLAACARNTRRGENSNEGARTDVLHGTLFFASSANFQDLFQPLSDAEEVIVDCQHLHVAEHSAIVAFETLKERYLKAGRRLRFVNLSSRNQPILKRTGALLVNA